jgi:hypothetical protein
MSDLLEHDLREAFADRAARLTPDASARLRAVDYHPRSRRLASRRGLAALGVSGAAAAGGAAILLASSAAPAFAGWSARPTAPRPGQLTAAQQSCGAGAGTPILTDTRGPYTASVYANGSTCLEGNGVEIGDSGDAAGTTSAIAAGAVELNGFGESDSSGQALTMVDGPTGAGVTGVTITRSDGSSVQATVTDGWYLAWWPGTQRAVTAQVASSSGTGTQSFPAGPPQASAACATGAHCSSSYGFSSAKRGTGSSTVRVGPTSTSTQ